MTKPVVAEPPTTDELFSVILPSVIGSTKTDVLVVEPSRDSVAWIVLKLLLVTCLLCTVKDTELVWLGTRTVVALKVTGAVPCVRVRLTATGVAPAAPFSVTVAVVESPP